ncbi:hypothetical protein [Saccharopolyspora mangrovi]|uniref:Uncharacterized protein n=1 Tax=Saccharopolyspora mangrovi TaxID=3082379 RepID=A0ABU6AID6_9PSEU|nr:hypothetical protein [Saccharopolyspora sp. S2-29]MEB3371305.1 hypothetical protein [Saccharopolyspora sp. S2-29]
MTAFDTYEKFIGSGALGLPWYRIEEHPADNIDADSWTLVFSECDFRASGTAISQHVITHADLMRAVRTLAAADGTGRDHDTVAHQCRTLVVHGPESVHFKPEIADQVIQVAAFGKVRYR